MWQSFTDRAYAPPVFETLHDLDRSSPFITAPKGEPVGGLLNFVMESTDDDNVFYNSMETTRIANGVVEVYHALEDDYPFRRIEFWDGFVCELSETMRAGRTPMMMHCVISAATVRFNKSVVFRKNWYFTDIYEKPVKMVERVEEEVEEKKITRLYWVDADTEEEIETFTDGKKYRIGFETKGYKTGEVAITRIKWEDGKKFADNYTELSFSGKVDENGRAVSDEIFENNEQ
jgi:hypothetical protein